MVRKLNKTLDFYVETLTGKTTGYVSKPHSNLESTECVNDYNLIPVHNHTPTYSRYKWT